jgi:hypothetical protein
MSTIEGLTLSAISDVLRSDVPEFVDGDGRVDDWDGDCDEPESVDDDPVVGDSVDVDGCALAEVWCWLPDIVAPTPYPATAHKRASSAMTTVAAFGP